MRISRSSTLYDAHLDRVAPAPLGARLRALAPGDARVDLAGEVAAVEVLVDLLQIVDLAARLDGEYRRPAAARAADLAVVDVDELRQAAARRRDRCARRSARARARCRGSASRNMWCRRRRKRPFSRLTEIIVKRLSVTASASRASGACGSMALEIRSSSALRARSSSTGASALPAPPRRRGVTGANGRVRATLGACEGRASASESGSRARPIIVLGSLTNTSTRLRNQKRYLSHTAIETDEKVYLPAPRAATYPQDEIIIVRSFQKLRGATNCLDVGGCGAR